MVRAASVRLAACLLFFLLALPGRALAQSAPAGPESGPRDAMVLLAAGQIDAVLGYVAESAKALGERFAAIRKGLGPVSAEEKARFEKGVARNGPTAAVKTFEGPEPAAQAPRQALFYYDPGPLTDGAVRNLKAFEILAPAMQTAFETFNFSWVYITGADETFAIHPYLPLAEGVNNYQPTQKLFYTIADAKNRTFGWESPYFDLAGAGMMITVSWPIFDRDALIGVSSRDVTIEQLSRDVMARLAVLPGASAVIINKRGKAIAASDPRLAAEIVEVNAKAQDAVLHYRTDEGITSLVNEKATASASDFMNRACERILAAARDNGFSQDVIRLDLDGRSVTAARTRLTGWYLVLTLPE